MLKKLAIFIIFASVMILTSCLAELKQANRSTAENAPPTEILYIYHNNEYTFVSHKSKLSDVIAHIGNPRSKTTNPDGTTSFIYWTSSRGNNGNLIVTEAEFVFNKTSQLIMVTQMDRSWDQKAVAEEEARILKAENDVNEKKSKIKFDAVTYETMVHLVNASEVCSWPIPEKKRSKINETLNDYRYVRGDFNFKVDNNRARHKVSDINFCIDDKEKDKFDKMLKRLKL